MSYYAVDHADYMAPILLRELDPTDQRSICPAKYIYDQEWVDYLPQLGPRYLLNCFRFYEYIS